MPDRHHLFYFLPRSDHRTANSEKRKKEKKLSLKLSQSIYQEVQFWDLLFHHLRFCPSVRSITKSELVRVCVCISHSVIQALIPEEGFCSRILYVILIYYKEKLKAITGIEFTLLLHKAAYC